MAAREFDSQDHDLPAERASVLKTLTLLEEEISAPVGSLSTLMLQDDWTVVIKGHALIEGMVTLLLASVIDNRLSPAFAKLPLGDTSYGKLVFAKHLNLISPGELSFIRKLSELRNLLAHNPQHLSFELKTFLDRLDGNKRKGFLDAFRFDIANEHQASHARLFETNPTLELIAGIMRVLLRAAATAGYAKVDRFKQEEAKRKAELLDQMVEEYEREILEETEPKIGS